MYSCLRLQRVFVSAGSIRWHCRSGLGLSASILRWVILAGVREVARVINPHTTLQRRRKVDILESFTQNAEDPFVFKIAHYSDQPEHFNAICGGSEIRQSQERIRDRIRRNIMESRAHHAWQVYNFDVLLVELEILPPLIEASESSEPSSSDEERSHDGNGGLAPKQKPITKERKETVRWIPRNMPLEASPPSFFVVVEYTDRARSSS